ncbi:hypothetical protein N7465_004270 [Penicillium sp. CMV-2018d]|nr:hypothetical protein N7465_004270 [Penicillium sp. CMV-2018d]
MDTVGLVGTLLAVLPVVINGYEFIVTRRFIYPVWEVVTLRPLRKNYSSLSQKFGVLQALVLITIFPDARQIVDGIEKYVLSTKTDEPLVLRKSTSEDCTMLAVAVAITALALTDLDQVHWTAEAAFVLSLIAGGLSVFYSCLVQQRMSGLFTPEDVKDFFSKPSSSQRLHNLEQNKDDLTSDIRKNNIGDESTVRRQKMKELESMIKEFKSKNRWRSASFHSIMMIKAPTLLLRYALASFVIGIGIYFGCLAFSDIASQRPRNSYRATFIVYIVTTFLALLIYYVPYILKELELSPARRHAQIMNNNFMKPDPEEMELLNRIGALLNSDEQVIHEESGSDDAIPEDM